MLRYSPTRLFSKEHFIRAAIVIRSHLEMTGALIGLSIIIIVIIFSLLLSVFWGEDKSLINRIE